MAVLRKRGRTPSRWRGVVIKAASIALVLALMHTVMHSKYFDTRQQAVAGGSTQVALPADGDGGVHGVGTAAGSMGGAADAGNGVEPAGIEQKEGFPDATAEQEEEEHPAEDVEQPAATDGSSGAAPQGPLACEATGLCSLGKSRRWRGPLETNRQLRDMLDYVAYNKEIVFITASTKDQAAAVNVILQFRALGMDHIVLHGYDEAFCDALPPQYSDIVSCAWDPRRSWQPTGPFWDTMQKRWEITARMLLMGYNVMSLDSDVAVLDDPYKYLKHPVFAKYNVLFHRDGVNFNNVNCGVIYWQNLHRSGPAMHMVIEMTDRTLRQREDPAHMKSVYSERWDVAASTWDQDTWNDMLHSASSGFPVIRVPQEPIMEPNFFKEALDNNFAANGRLQRLDVDWPPEWHERTVYHVSHIEWIEDLRFPAPPSEAWWAEHQRNFYPPQRNASSIAFMDLVRDAAPGAPLYEIGKPWAPPEGLPKEHFAFLPPFWVSTWVYRGQHGWWGLQPPAQVIAHGAYSHTPGGSGLWKTYINKGYGWWDWEVSEAYGGGNALGLPDDPKLMMLAPGVAFYAPTEEEWVEQILKMARWAEALGRRFVAPNVPCDASWLGVFDITHEERYGFEPNRAEDKDVHVWPDRYDGMAVLSFPDFLRRKRGDPAAYYCHWIRTITPECIKALPAFVDAMGWMERSLTPEQATPNEGNTLWHTEWAGAGGLDGPGAQPQQGLQTEAERDTEPVKDLVDAAQAVAAAQAFEDVPMLFLGAVPRFGDASGLPELPKDFQECYLFQPGRALDSSPTTTLGRDVRAARRNGSAVAAAAAAQVALH